MKIPFYDCHGWHTQKDVVVTLSEYLNASDWDGSYLHITGSSPEDYTGASSLFSVSMSRELAEKFFGNARVFSISLINVDAISVLDVDHLFAWARENDITEMSDLRQQYAEYRKLFPKNCTKNFSHVRISV